MTLRLSRAGVVAGTLLATGAVLVAATLPAGAATSTAAAGAASSTFTALQVANDTTTAVVGQVSLTTATLTAPTAAVRVAPAVLNGAATAPVDVTPANSPQTVAAGTVALPGGLGQLTGPALTASASVLGGYPVTQVTGSALGTLDILGTAVDLGAATYRNGSGVNGTVASAGKTVTVDSVVLPTFADLLAGLGLDVSALPVGTLEALLGIPALLDQLTATEQAALSTARAGIHAAVDTAQSAVDQAQAALTRATDGLASAQAAAASTTAALTAAVKGLDVTAVNTALAAAGLPLISGPLDAASYAALTPEQQAAIPAPPSTPALLAEYNVAKTLLLAANAAVDAAQQALDDAVAALDAALATVQGLVDQLAGLVQTALGANPLATLGGISVTTLASAGAPTKADAVASIGSLTVLGGDTVTNPTVAQVTSLVSGLVDQVTGVLNQVTGLTLTPLSVTPAAVTKSTGKEGAFTTAAASVSALSITLPGITLPQALALPAAVSGALAGTNGIAVVQRGEGNNGTFAVEPTTLDVATVTEAARFRPGSTGTVDTPPATDTPGSTGTPGTTPVATPTVTPTLPTTGLSAGVAVAAVTLLTAGLALARRRRAPGSVG